MKRPKASCAYRYGPPVSAKREATSAKQAMITDIAIAATTTASMLARPTRLARTEGRPKTPLPMMQFTVRAARLQRPIARTNPSLEAASVVLVLLKKLYHRCPKEWQLERASSRIHGGPRRTVSRRLARAWAHAPLRTRFPNDEGTAVRFYCRRNRLYGAEIDSPIDAAWARSACSGASGLRREAAEWVYGRDRQCARCQQLRRRYFSGGRIRAAGGSCASESLPSRRNSKRSICRLGWEPFLV